MDTLDKKQNLFGKLPAQYNFFFNPYNEYRFTRCPKCDRKTGQKKLPLFIWIYPHYPVSLNYTCRYCPSCDLLIAHQNDIESLLAQLFQERAPEMIGNDYLILGTLEKSAWKEGLQKPLDTRTIPDFLHDFKQVLKFEVQPAGWYPNEKNLSDQDVLTKSKEMPEDKVGTRKTHLLGLPEVDILLEKINKAVPIPAHLTKELVDALRKQGFKMDQFREVQINQAFYIGDEGGIVCDITPAGKEKTPILCSITQLMISSSHPLYLEIKAYQEGRKRKLAGNAGMTGFTISRRKGK